MRFSCDTNELNASLTTVSRALAQRSPKPILEGIDEWTEAKLHDVIMEAIPQTGMKNAAVMKYSTANPASMKSTGA